MSVWELFTLVLIDVGLLFAAGFVIFALRIFIFSPRIIAANEVGKLSSERAVFFTLIVERTQNVFLAIFAIIFVMHVAYMLGLFCMSLGLPDMTGAHSIYDRLQGR